ncbi:MAG: SMC-Scp complex subunit ScpB [Planctomycetota bacterium]
MIQRSDPETEPATETAEEQPAPKKKQKKASKKSAPVDVTLLLAPLEAVLFVAREPVPIARLAETVGAEKADVQAALVRLQEKYGGATSGIHLVEIAGGWRMLSNPEYADTLAVLHGKKAADRLSPAALETLAVIAYKQPVGRAEIERIRGVGVGPILRHLLELELVKVAGRDDGLGRALLYGTTKSFLDRFGLASIRDLPASLDA